MWCAGMQVPKRIDKSRLHDVLKAGTFLRREPMVAFVRLGACQINGCMRHIEIATAYHRFLLLQGL
jgi:hypothetical protein